MTSMTFGAKCSPCSAQFVKNENAHFFKELYPEAASAIQNFHYVDDFVMSFSDDEEALKITRNVRKVHSKGGFNLRKFVSNSPKVLDGLDLNNPEVAIS